MHSARTVYSQTLLNTDTSLLRRVCFAPGERKTFFFSSFNPLDTDTFYAHQMSLLTMQFRKTTISTVSTTKDALFGSENPLMRSNFLFHVKSMPSMRWHNSTEMVIPIFLDYEKSLIIPQG